MVCVHSSSWWQLSRIPAGSKINRHKEKKQENNNNNNNPPPQKKKKRNTLWRLSIDCSISVLDTGRPHDTEKDIVNVNVNVEVYSLKSPWVQQTLQFTPLVLELSLIRSHLLWGEFSAFSAADAIHNFPIFVPPGTHHCWVDRGGMVWEVLPNTSTH